MKPLSLRVGAMILTLAVTVHAQPAPPLRTAPLSLELQAVSHESLWRNIGRGIPGGPALSADTGAGGSSLGKSIGYGLAALVGGFGLGALIGSSTTGYSADDEWIPIVTGGVIGASVSYPIGVHLGNDRRGLLVLDYLPLLAGGAIAGSGGNTVGEGALIVGGLVYLVGTVVFCHNFGE